MLLYNNYFLILNTMAEESNEDKHVYIDKCTRVSVFTLLFFSNFVFNLDHGSIPAATDEISQSYKTNKTELGTFGSLVYLGTGIGAFILSFIINKVNRKYMIIACLLLNSALITSFTFVNDVIYLCFSRFLTGIFQAILSIYVPIWVDQYAYSSVKTIKLTLFHLSSIISLIFGYILTMGIKKISTWKVSFWFEAALGVALVFPYLFYDSNLFEKDLYLIKSCSVTSDSLESSDILKSENTECLFTKIQVEEKSNYFSYMFQLIKEPVS